MGNRPGYIDMWWLEYVTLNRLSIYYIISEHIPVPIVDRNDKTILEIFRIEWNHPIVISYSHTHYHIHTPQFQKNPQPDKKMQFRKNVQSMKNTQSDSPLEIRKSFTQKGWELTRYDENRLRAPDSLIQYDSCDNIYQDLKTVIDKCPREMQVCGPITKVKPEGIMICESPSYKGGLNPRYRAIPTNESKNLYVAHILKRGGSKIELKKQDETIVYRRVDAINPKKRQQTYSQVTDLLQDVVKPSSGDGILECGIPVVCFIGDEDSGKADIIRRILVHNSDHETYSTQGHVVIIRHGSLINNRGSYDRTTQKHRHDSGIEIRGDFPINNVCLIDIPSRPKTEQVHHTIKELCKNIHLRLVFCEVVTSTSKRLEREELDDLIGRKVSIDMTIITHKGTQNDKEMQKNIDEDVESMLKSTRMTSVLSVDCEYGDEELSGIMALKR